ncbi:hypothetical protein [Chryseobacterium gregarium]|uniref:hypothetical protein n=1 Tax=Chryseobacterium gregarium TaxID=456299 RepID=UPI0004064BC8|nr:hypothetical protein [Chryseobacterium gregarium]
MENFEQEISCAEMKLKLIKDILEGECNDLINNKKRKSKDFFDQEITRKEKEDEVNSMSNFASLVMPSSFFIEQMQPIITANVLTSECIHIYFIKNTSEISLLFRFNIDEQNDHEDINFRENEKLWKLSNGKLSEISANDAKSYIENFRELYNNQGFDTEATMYTQYITFHYENILGNFLRFESKSQLICAAKSDPFNEGKYRLNLILQIDRANCKNPQTQEKIAFFNVGNMQP